MNKTFSVFIVLTCLIYAGSFSSSYADVEGGIKKKTYHEKDFTKVVSLQGINKITARVSSFDVNKDDKTNFGNLEIQLMKCWKAPPQEEPENKALIKIWEQIPGEDKKEIFFGWMFSSSPALSALEHPVYDIVIKSCHNDESATEEEATNAS